MSRRKAKRRGLTLAAALGILVVCAGIAFASLRNQFGAVVGDFTGATNGADFEPDTNTADADDDVDTLRRDLLAEHGSWSRATPVRMAFASALEVAIQAAPVAETNNGGRWVGADPPSLRIGVVMVGDTARRAVVNGTVVGVGDRVDRAIVVAIERDSVAFSWGGRRLTYELDDECPREFRGEQQRRKATSPAPKQREEGQ